MGVVILKMQGMENQIEDSDEGVRAVYV